jgi:ABC-2 type transport system ATP-binding protein
MYSPVIEIVGLNKYYGKTRGIENINLQVNEGEIFGFIGPNGAGKSTTIRILLNLIFPDSGRAKIMGMDVTRDNQKIMQKVGYVPSDANAYRSLDVLEFLKYCHRFYEVNPDDERINELASCFELDLQRKIADLSMGNRKKVSIIQSLLHRPGLLILDEPTTGLDPLMQAKFFELLRSENRKGMTIFFSSHVLNEIQTLCKRVAIIKEGKIIGVEEIDSLRKKQLKKVSIESSNGLDISSLNIQGYESDLIVAGNYITFMFSGNINDLINALSGRKLDNLTIEEPTLEEIFMHYYR